MGQSAPYLRVRTSTPEQYRLADASVRGSYTSSPRSRTQRNSRGAGQVDTRHPGSCPCMETEQDAGEKGAGSHRSLQKILSAGATTTSIPCVPCTSQLPQCTTRHVPVRAEGRERSPPRDGLVVGGGVVTAAVSSSPPPNCCSPSVGGVGTGSDSLTPTSMEVG